MQRCLFAFFCAATSLASAYDHIGTRPLKWRPGVIEMDLQLDRTRAPRLLLDGHTSWNAVAAEALGMWNAHIGQVQFTTTTAFGTGDGNGKNEVFFSTNVYGQRFGAGVLAITTVWRVGRERVESDTIFNTSIDWDSYRGDLNAFEVDFRRVALHEFGHALGLDHPDQVGQIEVAVMNSVVNDLDTLARDDIRGARALYPPDASYALDLGGSGAGNLVVTPPPGLDGKYPAGTGVKLAAKADRRNRFRAWSGDENSTARSLRLTMLDDMAVSAYFSTNGAPTVLTHPRSQFARLHGSATLSVRVSSAASVSYQWQFEGADIPGATGPHLDLNFLTHGDSGLYACRVTNARGETMSRAARLVVDGY